MKKLHTRMLLFILAPTMLFISGMILYVSYTVHDMAINDAELILEAQGSSLAKDLSLEFEKALRSVQTISQSYQGVISEGNMPRREGANGMLKQLLENNPNYLSAWMFWQPNAFDGLDEEYVFTAGHDATGRFIPVWTKNQSGDLIVEPVVGYDTDLVFQQQLNYVLTGKNAIFEPFYYELNGENVLITSIVAPVIVNGRTLGMTGVDISLNNLNQLVREYTFYDHGFAGLMTNTGNVISHENQDLIGSNYFESTAMSERNDVEQVREAVQMGESAKIIGFSNVLQKDVYRLFTPLYMEGIYTPWSAFLAAPIDEVSSKAKSLTMIITTVSIIVLLFLSIIILWVTKHIVQPIRAAVEHGQEMAAGDFTRSVPELYLRRKDEIGQLAKIFATIREHMSVLIGQVQESTRLVLQSANSLAAGANQATSAANEVTTSIEEVAQAAESQMHSSAESAKSMEEMSHGVQRVAQAATAVSASVQEMNDRASLGQRNIENAVQQMDHLHHETNESKIIMERLQDGASQIVSIVDMITDISEQTNLLALNAAIEAARAGEAGKGFAVVAEEVRKLADETKDFASEIQELIGAIQTESNQATLAMNTNVAEVQRGIEHMQEVGQVFTQINTAVQEIVKETEELSAIAEEMSAGTEEIAAAAEEIASSAEVSAGHTQHVAAAAEEQLASMEVVTRTSESLQVMARQLNELLEQFKV